MLHTLIMLPVSYAVLRWTGALAVLTEAWGAVREVLGVLERVR